MKKYDLLRRLNSIQIEIGRLMEDSSGFVPVDASDMKSKFGEALKTTTGLLSQMPQMFLRMANSADESFFTDKGLARFTRNAFEARNNIRELEKFDVIDPRIPENENNETKAYIFSELMKGGNITWREVKKGKDDWGDDTYYEETHYMVNGKHITSTEEQRLQKARAMIRNKLGELETENQKLKAELEKYKSGGNAGDNTSDKPVTTPKADIKPTGFKDLTSASLTIKKAGMTYILISAILFAVFYPSYAGIIESVKNAISNFNMQTLADSFRKMLAIGLCAIPAMVGITMIVMDYYYKRASQSNIEKAEKNPVFRFFILISGIGHDIAAYLESVITTGLKYIKTGKVEPKFQ